MTTTIPKQAWSKICFGGILTGKAIAYCPNCGSPLNLLHHQIADDGTVSPAVICGWKNDFHDNVRLEGWTP